MRRCVLLVSFALVFVSVVPALGADPCSLVERLLTLPEADAEAMFQDAMGEPAEGSGTVKELRDTGRGATQRTIVVHCKDVEDGFVYLTGKGQSVAGVSEGQSVSFRATCSHWQKNPYRDSDKQFISIGCYDPILQ